ncbi:hypothetical protein DY000_02064056, partial [Brassica cretica]
ILLSPCCKYKSRECLEASDNGFVAGLSLICLPSLVAIMVVVIRKGENLQQSEGDRKHYILTTRRNKGDKEGVRSLQKRPNAKKLYRLFLNKENTTWEEFTSRVRSFQRGFMGEPKEVRTATGVTVPNDGQSEEDEPDYEEEQSDLQDRGLYNGTSLDYDDPSTSDEPELEEMLSD